MSDGFSATYLSYEVEELSDPFSGEACMNRSDPVVGRWSGRDSVDPEIHQHCANACVCVRCIVVEVGLCGVMSRLLNG